MKLNGEKQFANNLKKLKKNSSHRSGFFSKLKRIFSFNKLSKYRETIYNLKDELARKDHRLKFLREKVEKYKDKYQEVSEQTDELVEEYNIREFDILNNKARKFDMLINPLKVITKKYNDIHRIQQCYLIEKNITEMKKELDSARDNFQKIKVYRTFFNRLTDIEIIAGAVNDFLKNPDDIKNIKTVEAFVEKLEKEYSCQTALETCFADDNSRLGEAVRDADSCLPSEGDSYENQNQ
ncbi:MAG TPA: hypothetical protein VKS21_02085 [Spirochaetota bacterium]|nr:hypothetical protein [Spirochaetota bacterium]